MMNNVRDVYKTLFLILKSLKLSFSNIVVLFELENQL